MVINVCLVVVIVVISIILVLYNRLVKAKNNVKRAESGIDVVLKQRFDVIPNLVECVKGYSAHESTTLEEIVEQRTAYNNNGELDIKEAEKINRNINHIMAVAENYPELKASEQYLNLQASLARIEEKLQYARNIYNNEVTKYNNLIETVPSSLVAKIFAFERADLFSIDEDNRENVSIDV
ncbi:MAG: LemA family protein [Clostridia bacterium]|nr:LemA family protein [Clostridia bacterium]